MVCRPRKVCGWFLGDRISASPPVAMGKVNHAYVRASSVSRDTRSLRSYPMALSQGKKRSLTYPSEMPQSLRPSIRLRLVHSNIAMLLFGRDPHIFRFPLSISHCHHHPEASEVSTNASDARQIARTFSVVVGVETREKGRSCFSLPTLAILSWFDSGEIGRRHRGQKIGPGPLLLVSSSLGERRRLILPMSRSVVLCFFGPLSEFECHQ